MARRSDRQPLAGLGGDLPVLERTLANGLQGPGLAATHAPIVVCDLYYPVGSFDEPPGQTGLAHFVEHMLFKGTERFPKGQIDRLVVRRGGPVQRRDRRGQHALLVRVPVRPLGAGPGDRGRPDARRASSTRARSRSSGTVIGEERARELNSPQGRLDQTHLAVTYLRHPYRNPILGWPDDIARISVDDLTTFYREHYRPDGAVLVVVGDVDPEPALDRIAEPLRGAWPPNLADPPPGQDTHFVHGVAGE